MSRAHMTAEEARSLGEIYGRVYAVARDAMKRKGKRMPDTVWTNCRYNPHYALVYTMRAVNGERALTETDDRLISHYVSEIDTAWLDKEPNRPIMQSAFLDGTLAYHSMSASEAAEELGVSNAAVSKLIDQGKLDGVRLTGRCTRVTPQSVARYKRSRSGAGE